MCSIRTYLTLSLGARALLSSSVSRHCRSSWLGTRDEASLRRRPDPPMGDRVRSEGGSRSSDRSDSPDHANGEIVS